MTTVPPRTWMGRTGSGPRGRSPGRQVHRVLSDAEEHAGQSWGITGSVTWRSAASAGRPLGLPVVPRYNMVEPFAVGERLVQAAAMSS
jgi:hypothetical protein